MVAINCYKTIEVNSEFWKNCWILKIAANYGTFSAFGIKKKIVSNFVRAPASGAPCLSLHTGPYILNWYLNENQFTKLEKDWDDKVYSHLVRRPSHISLVSRCLSIFFSLCPSIFLSLFLSNTPFLSFCLSIYFWRFILTLLGGPLIYHWSVGVCLSLSLSLYLSLCL